ncbi:hypothetical protein D3C75_572530 [compost metagenome]
MKQNGSQRNRQIGVGTKFQTGAEGQHHRHEIKHPIADGGHDLIGLVSRRDPAKSDKQRQHTFQDPCPGNRRNDGGKDAGYHFKHPRDGVTAFFCRLLIALFAVHQTRDVVLNGLQNLRHFITNNDLELIPGKVNPHDAVQLRQCLTIGFAVVF